MIAAKKSAPKRKSASGIKSLEDQRKKLNLELGNMITQKKIDRIKGLAGKYDVLEPNTNRRRPQVETTSEDKTLDPRKRLLSHNVGRDLERNFSPAKSLIHQFKINVVGSLGKMQVNIKDNTGKEATKWFNSIWAKDCDYRDDIHWSSHLQNVLASKKREGDILVVFDDGIYEDSGKLLHFEADQIVNLKEDEFKKIQGYSEGWTQEQGVVRNGNGVVLGYIVTGKRGCLTADKFEDVTFYPRASSRLVKNPWRFNQGRGASDILTGAANFQDCYEMLSKELLTAKVAAQQFGYIKRRDGVTDYDDPGGSPGYLPENSGKTSVTTAAEGANSTDPTAKNYERFESLTGGYFEYMDVEDEAVFPNFDRPNINVKEFVEGVVCMAASGVGVARAYALLRADSSYTSFRGDMILTWATFYVEQKWLERMYADWVAVKALTWAMDKKKISALPEGWESSISWTWPKMPSVDELKEENATKMALKNGTTDYAEIFGPEWRDHFDSLSEQLEYAQGKNLPLSVFETIGGTAQEKPEDDNGDTKDDK